MLFSNELTVRIGGRDRKVFLQNGFYSSAAPTQYMHKHSYAEVHFVCEGTAKFAVDDKEITLSDGAFAVIPAEAYHGCVFMDGEARHCAFQIEYDVFDIELHSVNKGIATEFLDEIDRCGKNGDHLRISAFIALICSYLSPPIEAKRVTDIGFLISEFFSNNYGADARLEDLADALHLSKRQAERLVEAHTGRSFREELTATRMLVAERLIGISAMPLSQVAQYVGYRSYAGFWKAFQKYKSDI